MIICSKFPIQAPLWAKICFNVGKWQKLMNLSKDNKLQREIATAPCYRAVMNVVQGCLTACRLKWRLAGDIGNGLIHSFHLFFWKFGVTILTCRFLNTCFLSWYFILFWVFADVSQIMYFTNCLRYTLSLVALFIEPHSNSAINRSVITWQFVMIIACN